MITPWAGRYAGEEELVPGVGEPRQAPVDAVGVGGGVGLLLRRQQLPLSERVHRRVRVLPELRHRRDPDERHRQPHRPDHALLLREQPPVRADRQPPRRVRHRHRLHRALDPVRVAPVLTPVAITRVIGENPRRGTAADLPHVVGGRAHEEHHRLLGIHVPAHPLRPRPQHSPVGYGPIDLAVLRSSPVATE